MLAFHTFTYSTCFLGFTMFPCPQYACEKVCMKIFTLWAHQVTMVFYAGHLQDHFLPADRPCPPAVLTEASETAINLL